MGELLLEPVRPDTRTWLAFGGGPVDFAWWRSLAWQGPVAVLAVRAGQAVPRAAVAWAGSANSRLVPGPVIPGGGAALPLRCNLGGRSTWSLGW
ncbi:hypothetical protein GCM10018952_00380 [Streptosporangium vulgare]